MAFSYMPEIICIDFMKLYKHLRRGAIKISDDNEQPVKNYLLGWISLK